MTQFSSWFPLTEEGVESHAPAGASAVQIKRADGLVDYPSGKSAMVCYFYAGDRTADALHKRFGDEIEQPGVRGHGELRFRYMAPDQADDIKEILAERLFKFVQKFGEPPLFNRYEEE